MKRSIKLLALVVVLAVFAITLSIIAANSGKGIYLDDGTLVGHLLPVIDSKLGQSQKLNARLSL